MIRKISIFAALFASFAAASAFADVGYGTVQVGAYLSCVVTNNTPIPRQVLSVTYNVTCATGYGASIPATDVVPCEYNCFLPALSTNVYSGPATPCVVAAASCAVATNP